MTSEAYCTLPAQPILMITSAGCSGPTGKPGRNGTRGAARRTPGRDTWSPAQKFWRARLWARSLSELLSTLRKAATPESFETKSALPTGELPQQPRAEAKPLRANAVSRGPVEPDGMICAERGAEDQIPPRNRQRTGCPHIAHWPMVVAEAWPNCLCLSEGSRMHQWDCSLRQLVPGTAVPYSCSSS